MPPYNQSGNFNNSGNVNRPNNQDDWGGYIDVRMDSELKGLFAAWKESNDQNAIFSWVMDCLTVGLKFGLSWDGENQCYISTLTGKGMVGSEKRFVLTARAGSFDEAYSLLAFKHYVVLESDWGTFKPSSNRKQNWG